MYIRILAFALFLVSTASLLHAQDWPTFRANDARSGISNESIDVSRLQLAWTWRSEVPPDPAWDGPARWDAYNQIRNLPAMRQYDGCFHPVSDGEKLFFGSSSQDTLSALNLSDGTNAWSFVAGGPIRLAPTIDGNRILFGSDDGNAYCLDRESGELLWKFNPSASKSAEQRRVVNNDRIISYYPIRTGIVVRDGVAYFGASFLPWRESYICAIDVETGFVNASKKTFIVRHENVTLEGNLLIAENRLIVPQGRVAPMLFDRETGKNLGSLPGGGGVTVVLTEAGEVVRTEGGGAARAGQVGVFKGKERVASFPRGRSIVVDDGLFFVIDGQKLFAAERETNELKWNREVEEPLEIIKTGKSIIVGGRNHVTAVDAKTGKVTWSSKTDGRVFGLAVAGGKLIASTDQGVVHAFAPTAITAWSTEKNAEQASWDSPRVAMVRDKSLLHRWVFHRSAMKTADKKGVRDTQLNSVTVKDHAGDLTIKLSGSAKAIRVDDEGSTEAIELAGAYFPIEQFEFEQQPSETISVESWVRVDQAQAWGSIAGCLQDDGSTEHGWMLGYQNNNFCFGIAGGKVGLTYMQAGESFENGSWNHVVGTYDGREMRLYVNGSLAASGKSEAGPINYSGNEHFTIGAYKDNDELFPLRGAIHEVRIYSTPLDATTIANLYAGKSNDFPSDAARKATGDSFLAWGPVIRYSNPGEAVVSYGTKVATPSVIDLITLGEIKRSKLDEKTVEHKIVLRDLPFRSQLQFQIRDGESNNSNLSESFALDTHFDWTQRASAGEVDGKGAEFASYSPNPRGIAVVVGVLGADKVDSAKLLAMESELCVVLIAKDDKNASALRKQFYEDAEVVYGRDISVTTDVSTLPAAFASLVLSPTNSDAAKRLMRPDGGVLHDGLRAQHRRDPIEGSGEWSHMYGRADNSAFGGEALSEASDREQLLTQWIGRPGPRYQTDRQNRKPSPLAVGGRLFLQGQQRMIALDSFSGVVLWSIETPTVMRWNVPHDCSNWCADDEGVFVAAQNQAWFLDGKSGEVAKRFELPIEDANGKSWGYIARTKDQLLGTVVSTSAIYTKWWGSSQWFDSTGGNDTHVVAGDRFFSMDPETGEVQWSYDGLILHPTITVMDDYVYFVEDKTPSHHESDVRRISLEKDQKHEVVCLDAKSGEKKWSQPLDSFAGHIASLYLAGGGEADLRSLVLVASESTKKEFTVQTLNPESGDLGWKRSVAWEATHHGKHISRPAIQGELIYLRPEVLKLADGATITRGFPGGHGCSSYTLSKNGMFSRLGETTWWDPRTDKVNRFTRIRTDCWISVVPAQGMLLSAEGGGGCSCGTWLETSLGFLPRSVDDE